MKVVKCLFYDIKVCQNKILIRRHKTMVSLSLNCKNSMRIQVHSIVYTCSSGTNAYIDCRSRRSKSYFAWKVQLPAYQGQMPILTAMQARPNDSSSQRIHQLFFDSNQCLQHHSQFSLQVHSPTAQQSTI